MFTLIQKPDFQVLQLDIPGGVMSPGDLGSLDIPATDATQGIVISGRGPIWLYAALVHHLHIHRWVACYDPRLGGAVVVMRHHPAAPPVGSVVKMD